MSNYCQAYQLATLRRFPGWHDTSELGPDDVGFLGGDLVVRRDGVAPDAAVVFEGGADWQAFCRDTLRFQAPAFPRPPISLAPAEPGPTQREVPFTPGERWLLDELETSHPRVHNPRLAVRVENRLDPVAAETALAAIFDAHDSLRFRLGRPGGRWVQTVSDDPGIPLTYGDLRDLPPAAVAAARKRLTIDAFDLVSRHTGPLLWFVYVAKDDEEGDVIIAVVNHLVADGVSLFVLHSDLRKVLTQAHRGAAPQVPQASDFEAWSRRIVQYTGSPEADREMRDYWLKLPWDRIRPMELDHPEGRDVDPLSGRYGYGTLATQTEVRVILEEDETERWLRMAAGGRFDAMDLLMTALLVGYSELTGSRVMYLYDLDSDRDPGFKDVNLARTMGCVAQFRRYVLDLGEATSPQEALVAVHDQVRAMPNKGRTLEWLLRRQDGLPVPEELSVVPAFPADIWLNYRGRLDRWAVNGTMVDGDVAELAHVNDESRRNTPLDFDALVLNGRLEMRFIYSSQVLRRETVERLADACQRCIRELIPQPAVRA
jgi:non-ribosomal peptide synthase protein (TIGR01720 family)